jgi:hypothetical protein
MGRLLKKEKLNQLLLIIQIQMALKMGNKNLMKKSRS